MIRLARTLLIAFSVAPIVTTTPAAAKEFYVGEPIVANNMQIVPHYLLGIEMSAMPKGTAMGQDAVHLEVDVHATKDEKHGFADGEWIPYLTISYTIEKVGTKFKQTGKLLPMTAGDGAAFQGRVPSPRRQSDRGTGLVAAILGNLDVPLPEQSR